MGMKKYQKKPSKPVVVEAEQVLYQMNPLPEGVVERFPGDPYLGYIIVSEDMARRVSDNSWIVRYDDGSIDIMCPGEFHQKFDLIEEEVPA